MCRDGPPCWGHLAALCPSQHPGKPTVSLLPCPTDTRGHLLPLGCVWVSSYKPPLCVPPFLVLEQETPAHFRAGSSFPPGAFGVASTVCSHQCKEVHQPQMWLFLRSQICKAQGIWARAVSEGSGLSHQLCLGITFDAPPPNPGSPL